MLSILKYPFYCISIVGILYAFLYTKSYSTAYKENIQLKSKSDSINTIKENWKNQVSQNTKMEIFRFEILGITSEEYEKDMNNSILFNQFKPIVNQHIGFTNEKFEIAIQLFNVNDIHFDQLKYTVPSIDKNNLKNSSKQILISNDNIEFTPTVSGIHYWSGALILVNKRTGKKTEFPILDSIYVLP